jgi:ATP-dependent Zn protease
MRPLRRGERRVGIGQQRAGGAVEAVGEAGDAGRAGDAGDGRDDRDEVGGELARVGHARLGEQDRELAAGDARHEVGRPQPLEQRARHRAAAGIVRPAALEHDHRTWAVVAARQRGLPVERDRERPCGGQTCELVGSGRHPQPTRRGLRPSVEHASAGAGSGPFSACGRTIRRAVAGGDPHPALRSRNVNEHSLALAREWKRLGRAATFVALLTSPIVYVLFVVAFEWRWYWSLLAAFTLVVVFRGAVDVLAHKLIPAPTIYGAESELAEDDVISRRRLWYWRKKFRRTTFWGLLLLIVLSIIALATGDSLGGAFSTLIETIPVILGLIGPYALILPMLFLVNFLILFGPMVVLGAQQMKGYEPGDADWGVKLADIRGQVEAKEEITRVVSLWQSGEEFEKAGGKRERGVLFLGPPGTGKTMLSKGIATSFNCPFVTMPGSGFAQMFIGLDAVIVRMLARKAKKLAAKWGGQCIVFIDEIDAVGTRRRALGTGFQPYESLSVNEHLFYGPDGALTPDGDLVIESRAWRDRLFALRAEPSGPLYPAIVGRLKGALDQIVMPGGMGGGSMALNQLLVVMDGIDDPPLTKRVFTKRVNTFLDALYIVPQRVGPVRLRKKPPKPRKEEIYFIGACNVPLETLDPALTRPGRMGRHIHFRTPTWEDRRDIFDLYIAKVAHDPDLDTQKKRDELARVTSGYSPAMIDQVCSLALTYAHANGRPAFAWEDIVEAMTTVESGVAIGQEYPPHEERATAIHEAGHAVCSHLYNENLMSTRLSIRKRGSSGGHHRAMEIEERFADWRSEMFGRLIHILGAMAAEVVFYGQNTTGVGGDVRSVTWLAGRMVGFAAMAPQRVDLADRIADPELREAEEDRVMERFERIGTQIMHRSGGGMMDADPMQAVVNDPGKRTLVCGLLGQAYVIAHNTIRVNRDGVAHVADVLVAKREIYGDDVVALLDEAALVKPEIDVLDEDAWPAI